MDQAENGAEDGMEDAEDGDGEEQRDSQEPDDGAVETLPSPVAPEVQDNPDVEDRLGGLCVAGCACCACRVCISHGSECGLREMVMWRPNDGAAVSAGMGRLSRGRSASQGRGLPSMTCTPHVCMPDILPIRLAFVQGQQCMLQQVRCLQV